MPITFVRKKRPGSTTARLLCDSAAKLTTTSIRCVAQRLLGELDVGDVALRRTRSGPRRREALAVARVGEQVVGDDVVVRVTLEPVADEVRADEPGRAGDEDPHRAGSLVGRNVFAFRSIEPKIAATCATLRMSGRGGPAWIFQRPRPVYKAMVSTFAAALLAALGLSGPRRRTRRRSSGATFFVSGHGWGHGVGLAQYGAYGYALHGWAAEDIVAHYYPGPSSARRR